jgi:hypothetical protein
MGDGIKVVSSFIPRETLNILTFIPRNPCMHRIKVRTPLNLYATPLLGAVRSRALNAPGITIIQPVRYKLCDEMCCGVSVRQGRLCTPEVGFCNIESWCVLQLHKIRVG